MLSSNFLGGCVGVSRVPFLAILIITTIIANENGWMIVEGRTWPRMVQQNGYHHKEEIYSISSPSTSTSLKKDYKTSSKGLLLEAPKSEINSSLSPILPASLHLEKKPEENDADNNTSNSSDVGDYQDFNGNVSLRCNRSHRHHHSHHHSRNNSSRSSNSDNDDYNGDGRWWTTNSTSCLAGPFHLGADVNESMYNALCPLSSSTTNGKFPIHGLHCGNGGEWYTECRHSNKDTGISIFTLHKCDDEGTILDSELGECVRKPGQMKMETSPTACPMNRDDETVSEDVILQWVLHQVIAPVEFPDESKVVVVVQDLQSLEEENDHESHSRHNIDDGNDHLEKLCESSKTSTVSFNPGLHPHPNSCTKFIQCSADGKGSFFLKSCGPGTAFNPELLICDWPINVPQCSNGNWNGVIRRRRAVTTPNIAARRRCNFTGIQPDPQFCNKYRLCTAGGEESVHTCGLGTVFNPISDVCDFGDEVNCGSKKSDLGTYGCDEGDKYRAPHPDYCNKFVECEGVTLAVKNCPPGTLYDREEEKCDHAFKVTCRKPISLEHDIDVNWKNHGSESNGNNDESIMDTAVIKRKRRSFMSFQSMQRADRNTNNKLNLACDYNYIAPHPHSCNRFVECEQGRIFIKTCGPGTAFNPVLGQCDWPHNVREPDTKDCTRYRQCSLKHGYQTRSCQPGQYFDEETRKCVRGTSYQIERCSRIEPVTTTTTTTRRPPPTIPARIS